MTDNQLKICLYLRYSSHKQNEQSIEGQKRICMEYAERNGYTVVDEYIDRATSAKTDNRPAFKQLMSDAARGKWDAVLVYKLDRFARNRYDSAIYKSKLKKFNISVLSAMENITDSPEGVILESVLEGMAEYFSVDLSQKVTRGMLEGAHKCQTNGVKIFGYYETPDKKYAIDPKTAPAVRTAYDMYVSGSRTKDIVEWLNNNGYKTATGNTFKYDAVLRMLTNEKYTGVYRFADVTVPGGMPAIIDPDTYRKARQRADANKHTGRCNKAKEVYMLTFKLFCGECGCGMVGESGRSGNGSVYHYYKCSDRKKGGKCKGRSIGKQEIEDLVVYAVQDNILNRPDVIELIADTISKISADEAQDKGNQKHLETTLAENQKSIDNLVKAIEQGIITQSTKARLEELENQQATLKSELDTVRCAVPELSKSDIVNYLTSMSNYDKNDENYRKRLIDMFVHSVHLFKDKVVIVYNYTPDGGKKDKKISEHTLKELCSDVTPNSVPRRDESFWLAATFFGVFRRGNKPPVLLGEDKKL